VPDPDPEIKEGGGVVFFSDSKNFFWGLKIREGGGKGFRAPPLDPP